MKIKFKVGDKEVEYEFKHINIPEKDHGLDDGSLALLMKIDEGLVKSKEGITEKKDLDDLKKEMQDNIDAVKKDFNYEKLQEQLNTVFVKFEEIGIKPLIASKEENAIKERHLNNKWLIAFARTKNTRNDEELVKVSKELKTFQSAMEPIMHLGPATDEIDEDYSQGGYLVPELLTNEILRFAIQGGVARREFGYMPFGQGAPGNTRTLHKELTSVAVSWIDEGEDKPLTKPTTSTVTQTIKKLAAIVAFTEEILEDSTIDWIGYCAPKIGEAIAAEEDNQFFSGTGVPWTGIVNTAAVVGLSCGAGIGPLNMRPETLLGMTVTVPAEARLGGKFFMHPQVWVAICARRADAVSEGDTKGNYLVQTPGQASPGQIWGVPVVLVDAMPSVADLYDVTTFSDWDEDLTVTADEPFIIFGNLSKCCVYGDKGGLRVKVLDQASITDTNGNVINLAQRDMIALRVHKRVGYVVTMAEGICVLSTGPTS